MTTDALAENKLTVRGNLVGRFRLSEPVAMGAFVLLGAIVLLGVAVPLVWGDGDIARANESLQPPSLSNPFGTDRYGRDVFLRSMAAVRIDITLGLGVAAVALIVGSTIGAASATYGGFTDTVIMRITDILLAFPGVVLALIITASLGKSAWFAALAVTIAFVPVMLRMARSKALEVRSADYIASARLSGASTRQVAIRHVLPNSFKYPFVQSTLIASLAIIDFAALSFLGVGAQPPTAEWGSMIAEGISDNLSGAWWPSFFPGLMILLSAASFQIIGDWLDRKLR